MEILVILGAMTVAVLLSAVAVAWMYATSASFVTEVGIEVIGSLEKESTWESHVVPVDDMIEATIGNSVFLLMPRWSPIKRLRSVKIIGYSRASSGWPKCRAECINVLGVVGFLDSERTGGVNTNEAALSAARSACCPLVDKRSVDLIKVECGGSRFYVNMRGSAVDACAGRLVALGV